MFNFTSKKQKKGYDKRTALNTGDVVNAPFDNIDEVPSFSHILFIKSTYVKL